jgi:hypothetical protein
MCAHAIGETFITRRYNTNLTNLSDWTNKHAIARLRPKFLWWFRYLCWAGPKSDKLRAADSADSRSYKVREGKTAGYRANFTDDQLHRIDAMVAAADLRAFGYAAGAIEPELAGGGRPALRRSA